MADYTKYKRGSEWRKWDLHLHAPTKFTCAKNDLYVGGSLKEKQDNFIEELKAITDIPVIGITDYFSIEGYKMVASKKSDLPQFELILPNIELRITPVTTNNRKINLHIIPNAEALSIEEIERFLYKFEFGADKLTCKESDLIQLGKKSSNNLSDEEAFKKGLNEFAISYDKFFEVFNELSDKVKENILIGVSNNSDDGASGIKDIQGIREIIYSGVHFIFSGQPSDREYFLGNGVDNKDSVKQKYKSLKPCLHGSDYHGSKSGKAICQPDLNRFCWIKADTTFEGLRQIVYEPEERVRIQESNPAFDFEKYAFSEIEISNPVAVFENESLSFEKSVIPLNQNLITIIGGRGTGKSVLINYFANGFKQFKHISEKSAFNLSSDFKVKWKKSVHSTPDIFPLSSQHDLPFLFISQSEVKDKVKDAKGLGEEIKKILELESLSFDRKTDETIQSYKSEFNTNQEWFTKRDENNNPINQKSYVQEEIDKNQNLLERITTEENKEKLEKYSANIEKLQEGETDKLNLEQLKTDLLEFQKTTNEQITALNKGIPAIDFKTQVDAIDAAVRVLDAAINSAQEENSRIRDDFKDFKGDIASLLSNVERFRTTISIYERRRKEIEEKEKHLSAALLNKKKIADLISSELLRQKSTIDDSWSKLLQGKASWNEQQKELMKRIINNREIKIEGELIFDKKIFYDLIQPFLDGRKISKADYNQLESIFLIKDYESFISFINQIDTSLERIESYLLSSTDKLEVIFYELRSRSKYLYVQPKITYKGKPLNKLSAGQKGTIYLCMKLATNIFSQAIIFDQPEDDLDNDFIFNDLIEIFKEIKRYRQVIIVTHNANIVVNADAEQVIVASNIEEKLSYESGSLENPKINDAVCNILEGGRIAFQQRRNKYQFIE